MDAANVLHDSLEKIKKGASKVDLGGVRSKPRPPVVILQFTSTIGYCIGTLIGAKGAKDLGAALKDNTKLTSLNLNSACCSTLSVAIATSPAHALLRRSVKS